jgi:hypothetical protein
LTNSKSSPSVLTPQSLFALGVLSARLARPLLLSASTPTPALAAAPHFAPAPTAAPGPAAHFPPGPRLAAPTAPRGPVAESVAHVRGTLPGVGLEAALPAAVAKLFVSRLTPKLRPAKIHHYFLSHHFYFFFGLRPFDFGLARLLFVAAFGLGLLARRVVVQEVQVLPLTLPEFANLHNFHI